MKENKDKEKHENNLPDWTISDLYSQAWDILKKHKVLWILGAAAAATTSSQFNFRSSGNFSDAFKNSNTHQDTGKQLSDVLGAATSSSADMIQHIFSKVPISVYLLIGLELFIILAIAIIISYIHRGWATATLLEGTRLAIEKEPVTIRSSSEKALRKLPSFLWLMIIPSLILGGAAAIAFVVLGLTLAFAPMAIKIVAGILILVAIVVVIYFAVYLAFSEIWAQRMLLTEELSAKEALFTGYRISKKKGSPMVVLAIVNSIAAGIAIAAPFAVIIGIGIALVFGIVAAEHNPSLIITLSSLAGLLLIAAIIAFMFLSGVITAFKAIVWSLAYKAIKGKYE